MVGSSWQRPFSGYLFDLDGTLVDTAPDINAALNAALVHEGYRSVDEAHTRHWVGHGARVLLEQALDHQNQPFDAIEPMLAMFIAHYREHIADRSTPYAEVESTLRALRSQGAKLAVVTNKMSSLSIAVLQALGLSSYFDVVVCGDGTPRPKPDPAPAFYATTQLKLKIPDVLFVGDSQTDVDCARAAGCAVVCVQGGYSHGVDASELGADGVIERFSELVSVDSRSS